MSRNFDMLQKLEVNLDARIFPTSDPMAGVPGREAESRRAATQTVQDPAAGVTRTAHLRVDGDRIAREEAHKLVNSVFLSSPVITRRVVVFAAVDSGNGCSRVCNLAAQALASAVRSPVCLVDANFRSAEDAQAYCVAEAYGLADSLRKPGPITEFMTNVGQSNLFLLSRGAASQDSAALLNSRAMKSRIADLRNEFAYVLVDAPPLNSYADAVTLGRLTDGLVLVLEANSTRREAAANIIEHLRRSEVTVLGAVLNKRTFPIPQSLYQVL